MKSWKEVPHLFVGGGFKIRFGKKIVTVLNHFQLGQVIANPDWYTLIARKIEDMTDEELNISDSDIVTRESMINNLTRSAKKGQLWHSDFMQMLSIGVYPFDQSHFETDVIDIKTL